MALASAPNHFTIAFHGNCIDGWMSAYIAYNSLHQSGAASIAMFAISPNQKNTWPLNEHVTGKHVLLLDVSVPRDTQQEWIKAGVLSIKCIDHHASAIEHWDADNNPIDTSCCAAIQTWKQAYPDIAIPSWLHHVDRIDRWDNPTYEDRCVREVLNIIAHKPVERKYDDAFAMTNRFLLQIETKEGFASIYAEGKSILDKKDVSLFNLLKGGSIHLLTEVYTKKWNLPEHWMETNIFLIDTTNIVLDTTEAAHLVFEHYPNVKVFINYRKKITMGPKGKQEVYIYSARSRDFDLTSGSSILKGHKTSAGASFITNESNVIPFVSSTD